MKEKSFTTLTPGWLPGSLRNRQVPPLEGHAQRTRGLQCRPVLQGPLRQQGERAGQGEGGKIYNIDTWKMSTNSLSGGGLARTDSMPSPRSFFFDFRLRRRFSSSRNAAAACWSRAMNFSMSSKQRLRIVTSRSYRSLEVELKKEIFDSMGGAREY